MKPTLEDFLVCECSVDVTKIVFTDDRLEHFGVEVAIGSCYEFIDVVFKRVSRISSDFLKF